MPVVSLEGLDIRFPYDPYEIQKNLMSCVIKCIQNREHGLLESPTGTGKTASLLCASLAWQQNEKDMTRRSLQGAANPGFNARGQEDANTLQFMNLSRIPKIIYATRTHSQISQAVRELKRTSYNRVKTVILGSRDILCIHDEVSRLPESSTKIMACHMKVLGRTCAYYNNVQKVREQFAVGDQPAMDIEELVVKGKLSRFCPFFMSKELVADSDLIFMPYNYLLDPKLRASHGVDLKGCIIILDEAHNITKVCEDSSSFDLRSSTIAQCMREITRALNEFNEMTEELKKSSKDLTMGEIVQLKASIMDLEKQLDEASFCLDIPEAGKTVEGQDVLRCFFAAGFTIDQFGRYIRVLDGVSSLLASNCTEATGCDKFSGVLRVLSTRLLSGHPAIFLSSYAVRVELEAAKGNSGPTTLLTSFKKPKGKIFHFWCLNPAVGLDLLMSNTPRCVMLASGTLSPIEFLENELQMHFPVKIQNPHIITDKQLYAAVLKVGPGDVKLSSAFNNRGRSEYIRSLGTVIKEACTIVPQGVLVFFPSYSAMDQAVNYWKENGLWDNIASQKSVYVEPRGKRALEDLITSYYTDTAKGHGSCLMAVCRGKVSEGLDFTDGKCRAVIITGLPYAPFKNEQVTSKIKYLDSKANQSQGIKGHAWYNIDAVRALNQAVGRIIRHQTDFGAILLCDDRCDYRDVNQNLSSWVSTRVVRPSFSDMLSQLAGFFKTYYQIDVPTKTYHSYGSTSSQQRSGPSSGFQFNTSTSSTKFSIDKELAKLTEVPDVKFSELYDGGDDESFSQSLRKKSNEQMSALDNLQATTSPIVSFTAKTTPSRRNELSLASSSSSKVSNTNGSITNPKKKIKLISENRAPTYSRIAPDPRRGIVMCGTTHQHVPPTSAPQKEVPKKPLFKPLFSSQSSSPKPPEPKSFDNFKEYGTWIKTTLDANKYRKVQQEFVNYNKDKKDIVKLIEFGKEIFPQTADYISYLNGLRLVVDSKAHRAIVNDVISATKNLES
ncbi:Regulator of telomere elongation helicase 1 [Orchesella cincta]|uniref:Regulator of telomere elongation helicase 1 homolog n=1 Tax=Orchesella cincta TaxID=48709 RepID=A0A1D2MB34_ORCCI|nr:Regulator of telomere elongation helicase 1 [Orchesella cincta]